MKKLLLFLFGAFLLSASVSARTYGGHIYMRAGRTFNATLGSIINVTNGYSIIVNIVT